MACLGRFPVGDYGLKVESFDGVVGDWVAESAETVVPLVGSNVSQVGQDGTQENGVIEAQCYQTNSHSEPSAMSPCCNQQGQTS